MAARPAPRRPRPVVVWRAAATGALAMAMLSAQFWATASADALPGTSPEFIRTFTPAWGMTRLVSGMFWTALFGAGLSALIAVAFNRTRGGQRRSP